MFLCPEVGWTQNAKVVIYVHIFFFFFFFPVTKCVGGIVVANACSGDQWPASLMHVGTHKQLHDLENC